MKRFAGGVLALWVLSACVEPPERPAPSAASLTTLSGRVFYRPAHGGFLELVTGEGERYVLRGRPVRRIAVFVGRDTSGLPLRVTGVPFTPKRRRHHDGQAFEVVEYQW